jgi:hypothetical protein
MDNRERSILKTLLYANIFNYPLKKEEVWKFLISENKISKENLFKNLKNINKYIDYKNGYLFLKRKKELVKIREENEKQSKVKILKAKKISNIISLVPFVKFIGISGALSMNNSDIDDDIDLFIISEKNLAWTTRGTLVILLILLGVYRNRSTKNYKDKICLNMVIDEENLKFNKNLQNLYTAHEIVQIVPLFDRENTFNKFIKNNLWFKTFLPNILINRFKSSRKTNLFEKFIIFLFNLIKIENIFRVFQQSYMRKHVTRETLKNGFIAFHPFDYKSFILKEFNKKIKEYNLT